jgi:solute carrier family 25 aspartate/glutamate transporter 12/13
MAEVTTKVAASVKETLLGTTDTAASSSQETQITAQSRATFEKNARKDGDEGELYMNEEDFVNAVAPVGEDYVSLFFLSRDEVN